MIGVLELFGEESIRASVHHVVLEVIPHTSEEGDGKAPVLSTVVAPSK